MSLTRIADCEHGASFDDSCDRCDAEADGKSPARFNELDMMRAVVEAARWHAKHHRTGKEDGCPVCISLLDLDSARVESGTGPACECGGDYKCARHHFGDGL